MLSNSYSRREKGEKGEKEGRHECVADLTPSFLSSIPSSPKEGKKESERLTEKFP